MRVGGEVREPDPTGPYELRYVCELHPADARRPAPHKGITVFRRPAGVGDRPPVAPVAGRVGAWRGYDAAKASDPSGVEAVLQVADALRLSRRALAWCVEVESRWKPGARNPPPPKGSGAVGLIQWIPSTLRGLGYTSPDAVAAMTRAQQAPIVKAYLLPFASKVRKPSDIYVAIASGRVWSDRPDSDVVGAVGSVTWQQNPAWRSAYGGPVTMGSIRAYGTPPATGGPSDEPPTAPPASAGGLRGVGTLAILAGVGYGVWRAFEHGRGMVA